MGVIIALTLKEAMRRRAFLGTLIISGDAVRAKLSAARIQRGVRRRRTAI
jgi:hypothetical protein